MLFQVKVSTPTACKSSCMVIGLYESHALTANAQAINKAGGKQLQALLKREQFTGAAGSTLLLHHNVGQAAQRLLIVGLGKAGKHGITEKHYLDAIKGICIVAKTLKDNTLCIDFSDISVEGRDIQWQVQLAAQRIEAELWQFEALKSKKADKIRLSKITFICSKAQKKNVSAGAVLGKALGDGINYARELGNLPGNVCTPLYLAKEAQKLTRGKASASVKILNEKQMKALGMGSLLSVSAGSDEPAQLIVMEYKGATKTAKPTVLVGKGVTFDTGGISLKPGPAMDEMKFDMCGAASVFGTMKTLLTLKPKINVVAIVAASENMPNGKATKPGDIVTSMAGLTIEVLNTDAEGRLVLCDALTYSKKFKPKAVIDIATLTGACVIALGSPAHGLYSNDDALAQKLLASGVNACDKAWHMPLWDEYQQQLHSNFADIANIGGREAGSVTAACFLSRFTTDIKWAHLDIAGTAWKSGAAKGATGRPVSLLVDYLLNNA